jgi:hypothetical protein
MPLTEAEIEPGAIAYFDVEVLHADAEVQISGDRVQREVTGNQFVCHSVTGQRSCWSPLTATYRHPRIRIEPEWVANGYGPLAAGGVWLQDGKNTYCGPSASFVAGSATEAQFNVTRPRLSNAALVKIHEQISKRGGAAT